MADLDLEQFEQLMEQEQQKNAQQQIATKEDPEASTKAKETMDSGAAGHRTVTDGNGDKRVGDGHHRSRVSSNEKDVDGRKRDRRSRGKDSGRRSRSRSHNKDGNS